MDFDLVQDLGTTSMLFKVLALVGVGAAYVIFEALSTRLAAASKGSRDTRNPMLALELEPHAARAELTRVAVEAFRPISSWSSRTTD